MQLHFIIVLGLTFERFKQVSDIVLDQQRTTQNAHDLVDGPADLKVVFDDSDEAICDNSNVYLYADSILGLAPEGFDSQVLFNPLEKEFDLPPVLVKECDVLGRQIEVVRIVRERSLEVGRIVNDASDGKWIVLLVPFSCEADGLIPQDVIHPVKQVYLRCNTHTGQMMWDPLSVIGAVEGDGLFSLSERGTVSLTPGAETVFTPSPAGNCRYQLPGDSAWNAMMLDKIRTVNRMH